MCYPIEGCSAGCYIHVYVYYFSGGGVHWEVKGKEEITELKRKRVGAMDCYYFGEGLERRSFSSFCLILFCFIHLYFFCTHQWGR